MRKVENDGTIQVYAYGRASTDKQKITLAAQEHVCRTHIKLKQEQGCNYVCAGWYPDSAVTSKIPFKERPMGEFLLHQCQPGDIILVSNFDRIFRGVIDAATTTALLEELKIDLVLLDFGLDTTTPTGRLFSNMMAAMKQYEREIIAERTSNAQLQNKRDGKPVCQKAPIGWKVVGRKEKVKYVPDMDERAWGYEIVRRHDEEGKTLKRIALELATSGKMLPGWKAVSYIREVRLFFVSCKLEWQKLFRRELPGSIPLKLYLADHAGRPPHLEGADTLDHPLHTYPPKPHPEPISYEPADP